MAKAIIINPAPTIIARESISSATITPKKIASTGVINGINATNPEEIYVAAQYTKAILGNTLIEATIYNLLCHSYNRTER